MINVEDMEMERSSIVLLQQCRAIHSACIVSTILKNVIVISLLFYSNITMFSFFSLHSWTKGYIYATLFAFSNVWRT